MTKRNEETNRRLDKKEKRKEDKRWKRARAEINHRRNEGTNGKKEE